jgi:anti-sigma factor RsiW
MKCEGVRKELVAYLDGELEERLRQDVETHLAACADCAAEKKTMEATLHDIGSLPATEPTADLARRFADRIATERERGFLPKLLGWLRSPAVLVPAGAAVALLVVLLVTGPGDRVKNRYDETIASHMELFSDFETIKNLDILEDLEFIEALEDEV